MRYCRANSKRLFLAAAPIAILLVAIGQPIFGRAVESSFADRYRTFLFGVDYYPEQWPESYWEQDAQRMQDAGVNAVRMAEFGWSALEPEQGHYDFSLFDRAIATLGRHGIKTILGTPTATPPKWLSHDYPETLYVFPDGRASNDQSRQHYCYNSPLYRRFSREIVEAMASHYHDNANIIGWQIGNEFNNENPECFSDSCRAAFRIWLQAKFGSLDSLNARWGTRFWSQWYTKWDQVDLPFPAVGLQNPALMLDFRRFISDSVSSYVSEQIEIIRKHRPDDFVTTNGVFRNINYYSFGKKFDVYAQDNYPTFLEEPQYSVGASLTLVRGFSERMMVMEELTGSAGQTYLLRTPRPAEMSLWAFQTIAHGADGVLHFRWRTATRGAEELWSGVLDQDNIPGQKYAEFKRESEDIHRIAPEILDSKLISQVAVLNDSDDAWIYDNQYLSKNLQSNEAYAALFQAASEMKFNIDFIGPDAEFGKYRVIFAPRMIVIDPDLAHKVCNFVEQGGRFVLAARGAILDRDHALIEQPRPALLSDVFGVTVVKTQFYPSGSGNSIQVENGQSVPAKFVAESLKAGGATVLGKWNQDFLSGDAAYTENKFGKGAAIYYGSLVNLAAARELLQHAAAESALEPLLSGVPKQVEVTCRTKGGSDYFFILNHENRSVTVNPGAGFFDLLQQRAAPESFSLAPFQYVVLKRARKHAAMISSPSSHIEARVQ